jgi:hypothetical protein
MESKAVSMDEREYKMIVISIVFAKIIRRKERTLGGGRK